MTRGGRGQTKRRVTSTVGQKEIQRAVGKVISISGYRELTLSGDPEDARNMHAKAGLPRARKTLRAQSSITT